MSKIDSYNQWGVCNADETGLFTECLTKIITIKDHPSYSGESLTKGCNPHGTNFHYW